MQVLGWTPQQFWAATMWEFETAVLAKERALRPPAWNDEQTMEFFDRVAAVTVTGDEHA
jgi:hypothetical protein